MTGKSLSAVTRVDYSIDYTLAAIQLSTGDNDMGTLSGQQTGDCFSYTPARTRHNRYLS
jgi:hypothetical protein